MSSNSQTPVDGTVAGGDEYAVRWYEPGDSEGVLALFAEALDREWSRAVFEWKYRDDPYLSHVPVNLAERAGEVVGVQAYVPCRLRYGDRTALALQPADAVVHDDHRRNGLYTRMTRQAVDRYASGEPALFFNYPNPGALRVQRKLGWQSLGDLDVAYRVQRPSSFVADALDGTAGQAVGRAGDVLAGAGLAAADRLAPAADDVTVRHHDAVPAGTLAALYESAVPSGLHVQRDREHYDWWFANPARDYDTYVARSDGEPVAALVTRTLPEGVLQLREALPLGGDRPTGALGRLVAEAIDDAPDAAVVKSVGETLPESLRRRYGFVRDSAPVLDGQTKPLHLAARPLVVDPADGSVPRVAADPANWHPTFLEVDRD